MANLKSFSTSQVRGDFGRGYTLAEAGSWAGDFAQMLSTDTESETYRLLGRAPTLSEWAGRRKSKTPADYALTIKSRKFSSGIEFSIDEIRRDKTGQIRASIQELGQRTALLPEDLLTTLLVANGIAYDGIALFGDRTGVASGGRVDNAVTTGAATGTIPTSTEMAAAVAGGIQVLMKCKDEEGAPLNQNAKAFKLMIPPAYMLATAGALSADFLSAGATNDLRNMGMTLSAQVNPWLTAETKFYLFRMDGARRPLLVQEESSTELEVQADGSDYAIENDGHRYWAKRHIEVAAGEPSTAYEHTFS